MNSRLNPHATAPAGPSPAGADAALPAGVRMGAFEIQRVIARGAGTVVYLATDHALAMPVAIQEYLPAGLVQRDADLRLCTVDAWQEDVIERGMRAFIDESRMLAHCDHPALVRVTQLFEIHGTAYRVMPFYDGDRLLELRRETGAVPREPTLRTLLDRLLGALEAIHRTGQVHGGVTPANILLLADERPILLGPGAALQEISSDLVESLMASLETSSARAGDAAEPGLPAHGAANDLHALARVMRFCITSEWTDGDEPGDPQPLATQIARQFDPAHRPRYSDALLRTLDAAASPRIEDRPRSVAEFREWLDGGGPARRDDAEAYAADDTVAQVVVPSIAPHLSDTAPFAFAAPSAFATPSAFAGPPSFAEPPFAAAPAPAAAPTLVAAAAPSVVPMPGKPRTPAAPRSSGTAWAPSAMTGPESPHEAGPDSAFAFVFGREEPPDEPPTLGLHSAIDLPDIDPAAFAQADVAMKLAHELAARERRRRILLGGALTLAGIVLTAGVLAFVTGAWDPIPAMHLDGAARAAPETAASASGVVRTEPLPELGSEPPPAATAARDATRQANVAPSTTAAAATTGPRAACVTTTEFALYRCMETQCRLRRWASHPQCVQFLAGETPD